jgi:hypothetical protein
MCGCGGEVASWAARLLDGEKYEWWVRSEEWWLEAGAAIHIHTTHNMYTHSYIRWQLGRGEVVVHDVWVIISLLASSDVNETIPNSSVWAHISKILLYIEIIEFDLSYGESYWLNVSAVNLAALLLHLGFKRNKATISVSLWIQPSFIQLRVNEENEEIFFLLT